MELLSLEIDAMDYVEENKKDELESTLKDICGKDKSPDWLSQTGFPGPFFKAQDWGNFKGENLNEFEELRIYVLLPIDMPSFCIVLLQGRISKSLLEGISKGEIKNQDISKEFEAWSRPIFDRINGIISLNKNKITVLGQASLTVASFKYRDRETGLLNELVGKLLETKISEAEIKRLGKIIREEKIFANVGVNCGGIVSITSLANNYISFVGQRNVIMNAPEYSHDEYAVVELGKDIKLSEFMVCFPTTSSSVSHCLSRLAILQMLIFYLRNRLLFYGDLKDRMKDLQTRALKSDAREVSKVHEELWRSENDLLKEYTSISDDMNHIDNYLKFERMLQKDQFRKEIALPNEFLVSSETGKPLRLGAFDTITGDIEVESARIMNLYISLKEQYSLVSSNLRDKININLTMSNKKLQEMLVVFTLFLIILTAVPILKDIELFQNWLVFLIGFLMVLISVYALQSIKWFK